MKAPYKEKFVHIFNSLSLTIALRYLLARKTHKFASFVALISTIGIALGVCALIIVTSIMQGLQLRLKDNFLGATPHLIVTVHNSEIATLNKLPHVIAITPFVEGQAVLQTDEGIALVTLEGEEFSDEFLKNNPKIAQQQDLLFKGSFNLLCDPELLIKFNLRNNDKVRLISTQNARYTPLGLTPSSRIFHIKGQLGSFISTSSNNNATIKANYDDVKRLLRIPASTTSYRVYLSDPFLIDETVAMLPEGISYTTWQDTQGTFFKAVAMEKLTMSLMLFLIILVASFNILSALAMMVSSRLNEIAILKTLGLKSSSIMLIFIIMGCSCSLIGIILGLIFGIPLAFYSQDLMDLFNISLSAMPYTLPIKLDLINILWITIGALLLALLSALYPAYKASSTDPTRHLMQGY